MYVLKPSPTSPVFNTTHNAFIGAITYCKIAFPTPKAYDLILSNIFPTSVPAGRNFFTPAVKSSQYSTSNAIAVIIKPIPMVFNANENAFVANVEAVIATVLAPKAVVCPAIAVVSATRAFLIKITENALSLFKVS